MPQWRRLGLVYAPDGTRPWARAHAMLPTPLMLSDDRVRVYFASTDENTVGRIGYVELDAREPLRVQALAANPVLDIGRAGAFDDNGVNPCSVVRYKNRIRMYYVGYQLQQKIPYTLFTGCAESTDGGEHFERVSEAPILDRCEGELFFRTAAFVLPEGRGWRMWYIGGGKWTTAGGRVQPIYSLHSVASADGLDFRGRSTELLTPRVPDEIGFGRPFVRRVSDGFELYYSVRSPAGYRLGFARSVDGLDWSRCDDELRLDGRSEDWESDMTCYSAIVETRDATLMFYNGNSYGRTGVGVAILDN
jgi:hypothetical protein